MANDKKAGGGKKAALTKSQFFQELADATGQKKAEVVKVYDAMVALLQKQLKSGGGAVTLPGVAKITAVHTKADKGGQKKPNPFKPGEFIITKPKPARTKIKARGLKTFLESIAKK